MEKILDELTQSMAQGFEERQKLDFQYVVVYKRKSDESLIGYHLSTWCQLTDEKFSAKKYQGENPYGQLATINKNLGLVLNAKETDTGFFASVRYQIKKTYFDGLTAEDIFIDAEYLESDAPKQTLSFVIV